MQAGGGGKCSQELNIPSVDMCARLRQGHFLSQMASADPGRRHAGRAAEKRTARRDISEDVVGRTGGDGQGPLDSPSGERSR